MAVEIKSIFSREVLNQVPVFYRFMTEFKTGEVAELKVTARFSRSDNHSTDHYLRFMSAKPTFDLDIANYFGD